MQDHPPAEMAETGLSAVPVPHCCLMPIKPSSAVVDQALPRLDLGEVEIPPQVGLTPLVLDHPILVGRLILLLDRDIVDFPISLTASLALGNHTVAGSPAPDSLPWDLDPRRVDNLAGIRLDNAVTPRTSSEKCARCLSVRESPGPRSLLSPSGPRSPLSAPSPLDLRSPTTVAAAAAAATWLGSTRNIVRPGTGNHSKARREFGLHVAVSLSERLRLSRERRRFCHRSHKPRSGKVFGVSVLLWARGSALELISLGSGSSVPEFPSFDLEDMALVSPSESTLSCVS